MRTLLLCVVFSFSLIGCGDDDGDDDDDAFADATPDGRGGDGGGDGAGGGDASGELAPGACDTRMGSGKRGAYRESYEMLEPMGMLEACPDVDTCADGNCCYTVPESSADYVCLPEIAD